MFARKVGATARWSLIGLLINVMFAGTAGATGGGGNITDYCYAVADGYCGASGTTGNENAKDTLAKINKLTGAVSSVNGSIPNMSTKNVEGIAFLPGTQTLYGANANKLGTINLSTGAFTALPNTFGNASGYIGSSTTKSSIAIDDVDGITFEPDTGKLFGAGRRSGADVLVVIDRTTGKIIPNSFPDKFNSGAFVDFVEVSIISGLHDVDDISVDPTDGTLFGVINSSGSNGKLVTINKQSGAATEIGDIKIAGTNTIVNDVEGLSFFNDGLLYASTGDWGAQKNRLYKINKTNAQATLVDDFGESLVDIEGLACLTQQKFTISGKTVFQGTNAPISGVTVTATGLSNQSTNGSGQYTFSNVGNGSYTLAASKTGYVVVSQNFTNPVVVNGTNQINKDFVLACASGYSFIGGECKPVYSISGNATFEGTGSPISGVTITATGQSNQSTNASGEYSFAGVPNGAYTLGASKTGYVVVSQSFTNPVTVNGANQINKNFVLACAQGYAYISDSCVPVFSISGTVTLVGTGTPISGVTITGTGLTNQSTDGSGNYTFAGVPNGSYTLGASKTGYVIVSQNFTNPVAVNGGSQINKNFVLGCAPGYAISGAECVPVFAIRGAAVLEGTNAPVSGVSISGVGGGTVTGPGGTFEFAGVQNGSYSLGASKTGLVVKSQNFANPVAVNGADENNKIFVLGCDTGMVLVNSACEQIQTITLQASDGTFIDYVLVDWTSTQNATSYDLYRSDVPGPLGTKIATVSGISYQDTSAVPDQHYWYTAISNTNVKSNQDEGWRPAKEICPKGQDCINEEIDPHACASANSFLGQVNIASVINRFSTALNFTVDYRDLAGILRGEVKVNIQPLQKMDFIINDLGLAPDTYGTVCVTAETTARGAWSGGVTLYKANTRDGNGDFGSDFDFAQYYPFANPRTGMYTLPLNTYHLGVRPDGTVANWVRITDAIANDGKGLTGVAYYYNQAGEQVYSNIVNLPDGGRFDYSGHEAIGGPNNTDAVGMVRFIPDTNGDGTAQKYYMTLGRYYYECVGASCNDFYTAIAIPHRPGASVGTIGGISTVDGEITVIELNNVGNEQTDADISAFGSNGLLSGQNFVNVPPLGTSHTIVNKNGNFGFFAAETVGMANITPVSGAASASTFFYKLDGNGVLQYSYAAPFNASPGAVQVSEFNSFIENKNTIEIYNSADAAMTAQLTARNATNEIVLDFQVSVPAKGTIRQLLNLPKDTYGTLTLQANAGGLVMRNYVSRTGEYVLSFNAQ